MATYDRAAVRRSAHARRLPACLCNEAVAVELVCQTFANETTHYLLGCTGCGKLGRLYIPHAHVSPANAATAKPYRST